MADYNGSEEYIASQDQEVASTGKKYGGLVPKKKPLISKDHERAFFDSADWALCKSFIVLFIVSFPFMEQQAAGVNQKSTVAIENLRPKLQRTPHQQLPPRRPACTSGHQDSLVNSN
ncbi:uncharacterized protein LOC132293452 isoform X1 [Cornus florida]|uniref:uncharacterized protein LOC132293452 isoform X1 n=1 Tax=Cornus florida TaxID=4283 RepID=UPI00289E8656|nr:uncharacterized protein LOC132293452 isoform X1 [Cornus florida]XP_059646938.1 uncharacterized protein LOC132293452 isoform X1 [Cornus florida]XP_059646947.1 uncharacterized protein LOC132293452 isoform X1 [Cornus florida]